MCWWQRRPHSDLVIPAVPWLGFLQAQPAIAVATITFNQPFNCRTKHMEGEAVDGVEGGMVVAAVGGFGTMSDL